jgi:hypothetical protein
MNGWPALDRFLRTDPRDVGCAEAMEMLHVYVDLVAAGKPASSGTRASRRTCAPAARAVRTSTSCWPRYATTRANRRTRDSLGARGVLAQVPDQADDILGDEPADGAAGVQAEDDPAAGVEHADAQASPGEDPAPDVPGPASTRSSGSRNVIDRLTRPHL